jgi:hypothetical protein
MPLAARGYGSARQLAHLHNQTRGLLTDLANSGEGGEFTEETTGTRS